MDFTTNYCGIYWSDGKFQSSVVGTSEPVSELDLLCKEHDAAYAVASSDAARRSADNKFFRAAKKLGVRGNIYGRLVKHYNDPFGMAGGNTIEAAVDASGAARPNLRGVVRRDLRPIETAPPAVSGSVNFCSADDVTLTAPPNNNFVMSGTSKKDKAKKGRKPGRPQMPKPVSYVTAAPVSIGNSVRGSSPTVTQTTNGARVVGRDFAFALNSTASTIVGWELIGGMPITPSVLPSSILRNYCQMFNKFQVNRFSAHYITSSPTSQSGDILFYYEKDRFAPMCDYSNSSFLPFVLSDPNTLIGPQWANHSIVTSPAKEWKTTLYGNQSDLNEDAAGTLFLFSKTSSANSPGYMVIDYDISFRELSVNPRAGTLPIARGQSSFVCFNSTASITAGTAFGMNVTTGKTIANTTSTAPTGLVAGDIFKAVLQVTSSTIVNAAWNGTPAVTSATIFRYSDTTALTVDDGTTLYVRYDGTNFYFYSTLENAITNTSAVAAGVTSTTPTLNLCAEIQLVYNISSLTQSAY